MFQPGAGAFRQLKVIFALQVRVIKNPEYHGIPREKLSNLTTVHSVCEATIKYFPEGLKQLSQFEEFANIPPEEMLLTPEGKSLLCLFKSSGEQFSLTWEHLDAALCCASRIYDNYFKKHSSLKCWNEVHNFTAEQRRKLDLEIEVQPSEPKDTTKKRQVQPPKSNTPKKRSAENKESKKQKRRKQ